MNTQSIIALFAICLMLVVLYLAFNGDLPTKNKNLNNNIHYSIACDANGNPKVVTEK